MDSRDTGIVGGVSALEFLESRLISVRRLNTLVIVSKQRLDLALQTLQSQETKFRQHERFLSLCLVRSNMSQTDRLAMTMTMIQKMMPIQPPFHSQLLSSGCWVAGSVVFRISLLVRMLLAQYVMKMESRNHRSLSLASI